MPSLNLVLHGRNHNYINKHMSNILNLSSAKLGRIAALKGQLEKIQSQLQALVGESAAVTVAKPAKKKRTMSAAGRAKIAAAARARWAKVRAATKGAPKKPAVVAVKKKRTMRAAGRAKIAAAARARWAKVRAAKAK